jgi:hypothetical protein
LVFTGRRNKRTRDWFFSITGAAVTLGGVLVGIGAVKGRLADAAETNAEQAKRTEKRAARDELAAAIRRSGEMLAVMQKRADEDRAKSEAAQGVLRDS